MSAEPIALLAPERRFENEALREATHHAASRVIGSGRWILGEEVEALERLLQQELGARHALAVKSGTDALLLALMALDISRGDHVLTSPFSFFASASTIVRAGATPRFVDICPGCFCLSPADAHTRRTANTRAILPVHLFGQSANMASLLQLAHSHGLYVVEDVAQAQGADFFGQALGTLGDVGCYSFFPSKNLSALGDGGAVVCQDDVLARRLMQLRNHGSLRPYEHVALGGNFRLDALQAALVAAQQPHHASWTHQRQAHAARYDALFCDSGLAERSVCTCHDAAPRKDHDDVQAPIGPPARGAGLSHTYNQYVLRLRGDGLRDHVRDALVRQGIGCAIYYPQLLCEQPALAHLGAKAGDYPHAQRASHEVLALPIYAQLRACEQLRVAHAVIAAVHDFGRVQAIVRPAAPLQDDASVSP